MGGTNRFRTTDCWNGSSRISCVCLDIYYAIISKYYENDTIFGDCLQQSEMKFEVYEDKKRKEWMWKLKFRNGVPIANGAYSYKDYEVLQTLIQSIKEHAKDASIIIDRDASNQSWSSLSIRFC